MSIIGFESGQVSDSNADIFPTITSVVVEGGAGARVVADGTFDVSTLTTNVAAALEGGALLVTGTLGFAAGLDAFGTVSAGGGLVVNAPTVAHAPLVLLSDSIVSLDTLDAFDATPQPVSIEAFEVQVHGDVGATHALGRFSAVAGMAIFHPVDSTIHPSYPTPMLPYASRPWTPRARSAWAPPSRSTRSTSRARARSSAAKASSTAR